MSSSSLEMQSWYNPEDLKQRETNRKRNQRRKKKFVTQIITDPSDCCWVTKNSNIKYLDHFY